MSFLCGGNQQPSLPWRILGQLMRLSDDPERVFPVVVRWGEQDPRLHRWLVGLRGSNPNSPFAGSLERDLERLGLERFQRRVAVGAVRTQFRGPLLAYGLHREWICRRAVLVALWAEQLASRDHRRGLKALIAGLFALAGTVPLDAEILAASGSEGGGVPPDFDDIDGRWEWERARTSRNSLEAGAALSVSWGFSRCLSEMLLAAVDPAPADRWQPMGAVLRLAHLCARLDLEMRPSSATAGLLSVREVRPWAELLGFS